MEKINRVLLAAAADKKIEKGRKVRVDCTVVESNIHHPTDSTLLEDGVRVLCRLTQAAKGLIDVSVTDHSRRARKRALGILNARKERVRTKLYRDLLKVARKVVRDAEAVAKALTEAPMIDPIAALGIEAELRHYIPLVRCVIDQAERRVIRAEKVPSGEKLVSIFEPHADRLEPAAPGLLGQLVDAPRQAAFDGGFASKENLVCIKTLGVKDVAFHKKRGLKINEMAKSTWVYKRLRNFRAGIEGMISFLKRCLGLDRCNWRGRQSLSADRSVVKTDRTEQGTRA